MDFVIDIVGSESEKITTKRTVVSALLREYKTETSSSTKNKSGTSFKKQDGDIKQMKKLVIVPPFEISEKNLKKQRKKESELTKGKKWYGLPATELTEEIEHDLEVLKMRSALDPKRFYKKNDLKVWPKYFQVGKVINSPLDYYNNRLTKKERKKTLTEELLANKDFMMYNRKKYKKIILEKQKTHYKAWQQAKKLKKNK